MFWFQNSTDANKLYTALDNTYEAIAVSRLDVGQKGDIFQAYFNRRHGISTY